MAVKTSAPGEQRPELWKAAQRSVIGALLLWPDELAGKIFREARAAYFDDAGLRHLFEAAQEVYAQRRPVDPVTVLAAAGGAYEGLIAEAMQAVPTAANVDEYLRILRAEARLSGIRSAGSALAWATSEEEALAAYERVGALLRETDSVEDLSFEELLSDYLDRMNDPTPPDYLSWGISQLDGQLFVSPGDFCVLAGDSSSGKTALALQFAYHMAETGKRVLFFSLETGKEKLEDRLMSERQVAAVDMKRSKTKSLTSADYRRVTTAGVNASKIPLRIIRRADTLALIRNRTVMHAADVIFIDYLQIIDHSSKNRFETVTEISMALHRMATQLGVTVIALSQVTPPEHGEISIQDMRESGQIKNDAEVILILSKIREKGYPNARQLKIGKDKDGAQNRKMLLSFDPQHMTFSYAKRVDPDLPEDVYELDEDEGGDLPSEFRKKGR